MAQAKKVEMTVRALKGIACIPIQGSILLPLANPSHIVVDVDKFPECMQHVLRKLTVAELDGRIPIDTRILGDSLCKANAAQLLSVLHEQIKKNNLNGISLFHPLSDSDRRHMFEYFVNENRNILNSQLPLLKSLACFETFASNTDDLNVRFTPLLSQNLSLAPRGTDPRLLGAEFLRNSDIPEATAFFSRLGIHVVSRVQFLSEYVLPKLASIEVGLRDATLLSMLEDLMSISKQAPGFREQLEGLKFVPTAGGTLQSPKSLFDPDVLDVQELMDKNSCYPHEKFASGASLHALRSLGLRTTLDCNSLVEIARHVASITDTEMAVNRATALLRYLDNNMKSLFRPKRGGAFFRLISGSLNSKDSWGMEAHDFFKALQSIPWIPVLCQPPIPGLPWRDDFCATPLVKAEHVRPEDECWLVSSQYRLLYGYVPSCVELREQLFSWNRTLNPVFVARQLVALSNIEFRPNCRDALHKNIARKVPALYEHIDKAIRDPINGYVMVKEVESILNNERWVWTGSGFQFIHQVAMECFVDCRPWLYVIPSDLGENFADMFLRFGMCRRFDQTAFISVLESMQRELCNLNISDGCDTSSQSIPDSSQTTEEVTSIDNNSNDNKPKPSMDHAESDDKIVQSGLSPKNLSLAVALVSKIGDLGLPTEDILVPNENAVLCRVSTLVYNDSAWAPPAQHQLVHGKISNLCAKNVGVRSLVQAVVDPANSVRGGWEAYGQTESLTHRLRGLLDVYPDGPSIFKELIQNADDAGATKMSILYSAVTYGTTSLLGEDMSPWQGPALYVYNNAKFRSQDFDNLANLARSDKSESAGVTGRFGVGFNSVYHFTDVPCILSGEHLVMLDPHKSYLPGAATYSKPGLKLKFTGTTLTSQFPDQFKPFLDWFGADMQNEFDGTLFRFPLRGEEAALRSELKNESYGATQVADLFTSFQAQIEQMLLFLKNIKSLTVEVAHTHGERHTLYAVDVADRDQTGLNVWSQFGASENGTLQHSQLIQVLGKDSKGKLSRCQRKIDVCMKGYPPKHVQDVICGGHRDHDIDCDEEAISTTDSMQNSTGSWIVFDQLGGDRLNELVVHPEYSHLKLVPRMSIAVKWPTKTVSGNAFVVLPLPVNTGLPVHVNAQFEVSNNRRDLWSGADMTGDGRKRTDWNNAVLAELGNLYAHAMKSMVKAESGDARYCLFPNPSVSAPWDRTVSEFYRQVQSAPVIGLHSGAVSAPSDAVFIPPNISPFRDSLSFIEVMSTLGVPIVESAVPQNVSAAFSTFTPESTAMATPKYLRSLTCSNLSQKPENEPIGRRASASVGNKDEKSPDAHSVSVRLNAVRFDQAMCVVDFLLSDNPQIPADILHVPMVPLEGGEFAAVQPNTSVCVNPIYICDGPLHKLMQHLDCSLLHQQCHGSKLHHALNILHASPRWNICHPLPQDVSTLLLERVSSNEMHGSISNWESSGLISKTMLKDIWQYIDHAVEQHGTATVFRAFANVPILPTSDQRLHCLGSTVSLNTILSLDSYNAHAASALTKLHCTTLDHSIVTLNPHILSEAGVSTVNDPSAVLRAIESVCRLSTLSPSSNSNVINEEKCTEPHDKCVVDASKFSPLDDIEKRAIFTLLDEYATKASGEKCGVLAQLPILEVMTDDGRTEFASASEWDGKIWLPPSRFYRQKQLLLAASDIRFILPAYQNSMLVRSIGIRPLQRDVLFADHILPRFHDFSHDLQLTITSLLLSSIESITRESIGWPGILSSQAFVPNRAGRFCKAEDLFHPSVVKASSILRAENVYPMDELCNEQNLQALQQLGLRSSINSRFVLRAAEQLSKEYELSLVRRQDDEAHTTTDSTPCGNDSSPLSTTESLIQQAEAFIEFINSPEADLMWRKLRQDENVFNEFASEIRAFKCVPIQVDKPDQEFPWKAASNSHTVHSEHLYFQLQDPLSVRPREDMWLAGSSLFISKFDVAPATKALFGWDTPLTSTTALNGIISLQECWGAKTNERQADFAKIVDDEYARAIAIVADSLHESNGSTSKGLDVLQNQPCVWVGNEFVETGRFALSSDKRITVSPNPFLYTMQDQASKNLHRVEFYKAIGVRDMLTPAQYAHVLEELSHRHGASGISLNSHNLSLCCDIVKLISCCEGDASLPAIPTSEGFLLSTAHVT